VRLVALLGMGGIGKTQLAARLAPSWPAFEAHLLALSAQRPTVQEWLGGAIGFLSDQQLVTAPC